MTDLINDTNDAVKRKHPFDDRVKDLVVVRSWLPLPLSRWSPADKPMDGPLFKGTND
ncbi:hypothetical protein J6590_019004 [Homalodisca vitripennis]|nr:hypothetical protein J6590_019004 [Homalodisca vitripennis]